MILNGALTTPATSASNAAVTNNHTLPQSINSTSIFRRNNGLLCNQSYRRFTPVNSVTGHHHPNGVAVGVKELEKEKSLAERLRLGSLTEDGLSYRERFVIRCFEVGINKTATVETIANLLQVIFYFSIYSTIIDNYDLLFYDYVLDCFKWTYTLLNYEMKM